MLKTIHLYAFLTHMQMLLFSDANYLDNCQKSLSGYARDTGDADSVLGNRGAKYRRLLGQRSKLMRFSDRLFIPLFTTERLMMSAGDLMIKIFFNSNEFCLTVDKEKAFEVDTLHTSC